ncbi:MAG: hypothetical protein PHV18_14130 [Lachnospiraceae bacterium]|nr:hypothetical protein [Lachnospiraceae bacterium]
MLQLLETGRALYVLAAICLLGIVTRAIAKHLYKRLLKESGNLAMTKNKSLKELRQRAENTYRMNQGLRDSGAWLEHQLYELRVFGISLSGWSNLATQWTWLCLLAGGVGAFFSYWYRLDTYYIVMYGGGAVLMAMLTMLFDNGMNGSWRDQLSASLQDYLENVMCPRLARNQPLEGKRTDAAAVERPGLRSIGRGGIRGERADLGGPDRTGSDLADADQIGSGRIGADRMAADRTGTSRLNRGGRMGAMDGGIYEADGSENPGAAGNLATGNLASGNLAPGNVTAVNTGGGRKTQTRSNRRQAQRETAAVAGSGEGQGNERDIDYLKRSLEQIAASREKSRVDDENWLKDLRPEEVELIGDILKQYLA